MARRRLRPQAESGRLKIVAVELVHSPIALSGVWSERNHRRFSPLPPR